MALRQQANIDARCLQVGTPYDSLGGLADLDVAWRIYLTGSTGTTECDIGGKGVSYMSLVRTSGTHYGVTLKVRFTTAGAKTYSLGTVTADTWHSIRCRISAGGLAAYVDGVEAVADATVAGDTFLDDNANAWRIGPGLTSNGLEVQTSDIVGVSPAFTAGELTTIDSNSADWSALDLSGKTEWFYWNLLKQTSGTATNTDTGFDNENTNAASLGDFQIWAGKTAPTWNTNSPVVTPADLEILLDGQRHDRATIDLGVLPMGSAATGTDKWKLKGQIYNAGGTTFTVSETAITGDIVGTPTEPTGAVASGTTLDFDFAIDTTTAGAVSVEVAITADESQTTTITFEATVRAIETTAERTITADDANYDGTAGSGFNASAPTESGTAHGEGFDSYQVPASFDCMDRHFVITDDFAIGVFADHGDFGHIDYVEFFFENATGTKIYTESPSPRHGRACYWAMLDVSSITETLGIVRVYARVVPVNGLERLLSVDLVLNTGGAANESVRTLAPSGADLATVELALEDTTDQATKIQVIEFTEAGTYAFSGTSAAQTPGYVKVFRLGSGLVPGDVWITGEDADRDGTPLFRTSTKYLIFEDISVQTENFVQWYVNTGDMSLAFHGTYDFRYSDNGITDVPLEGLGNSTNIGQQFFRNYPGDGQQIGLYGNFGWDNVLGPTSANILLHDLDATKVVKWSADSGYWTEQDHAVLKAVYEEQVGLAFQRTHTAASTLTVDSVSDEGGGRFKINFSGTPTFSASADPAWRLRVITTTGNAAVGDEYTLESSGGEDTDYDTNGTTGYWVTTEDGYTAGDLVNGDTVALGITFHADTWQFASGVAAPVALWWDGFVDGYEQQTMLPQSSQIRGMVVRNLLTTRTETTDQLTQWSCADCANFVCRHMSYAGPEKWTTAGSWGSTLAGSNLIQNSIFQQANTDLADDERVSAIHNCHFDAGTARGIDSTGAEELAYDVVYRPTGFTANLERAYNVRAYYDRLGNRRRTDGTGLLGATEAASSANIKFIRPISLGIGIGI